MEKTSGPEVALLAEEIWTIDSFQDGGAVFVFVLGICFFVVFLDCGHR